MGAKYESSILGLFFRTTQELEPESDFIQFEIKDLMILKVQFTWTYLWFLGKIPEPV